MYMNRILLFVCFLGASLCCEAQDLALANVNRSENTAEVHNTSATTAEAPLYSFDVYGSVPNVSNDVPEKHYLGEPVTAKWNTFLKNFTRQYDVSVGLSDNSYEILKPSVYNAVKRANKYVKQLLKANQITHAQAVDLMDHVLDCANTIVFEPDTKNFEQAAKDADTGEKALKLFECVKLVVNG